VKKGCEFWILGLQMVGCHFDFYLLLLAFVVILYLLNYRTILTFIGTWIRDLISTLPSTTASKHTFIGTDINPKDFPSSPPPNTAYVIQDILSPYPPTWHSSFSFIHQRLVLPGAGTNQKLALQSLTELVKPSGWIQLIEAENIPHPDDGPHMHDFITFKRAVFTGMGANLKLTSDIPEWLGEVSGFHKEEVQSELVWMKLGAANRSEELGKRGVYSTGKLVEALVPFAKGLGTFDEKKVFGESGSTLDGFAEDLRGELRSRGGHLPLRVLWAQRST
jgi:hypothetical protein